MILKAVDNGWTAWDAWQATQVLADPNASPEAKDCASKELAMTAAFEALEPDDLLPVALPIDDLARKGIIKLGKDLGQETAEAAAKQGFRRFSAGSFRENLSRLTGRAGNSIKKMEAHHVLPQEFVRDFRDVGIDIHDPKYGSWVPSDMHQGWSRAYNDKWRQFFRDHENPNLEDILNYARQLSKEYGFDVLF